MLRSRAAERTPTLFMTFPGRRSLDVSRALAERSVLAPAGSFYWSPQDVDRLLNALADHLGA